MRYFFLIISVHFSSIINAQVDIINRSLTDSSLNYLYIGVDNVMELIGVKDDRCTIMVQGGGNVLNILGKTKSIIRVSSVTDSCFVTVYNNKSKKLFQTIFKVRMIPYAVVTLAGFRDTVAKKGVVLANPFLKVVLPNCFYNLRFRILSFTAEFVHDGDTTYTTNLGYIFSKKQVNISSRLAPGDFIYFENIKGVTPDSRITTVPPFWIKIG